MARKTLNRPPSLADQAADQIRDRIIKGDFQLGEALSETALAAELGVSKTPVREALLRLKTEGLVEIQPQRGTFVFRMGIDEIHTLSEFRDVLETSALAIAMREKATALGSALNAIVLQMKEALAQRDAVTYRAHDSRFHACIVNHCDNAYLWEAYAMIAWRIQTLRNRLSLDPALNARSFAEHETLARMVADGRNAEAVAYLRMHIATTTASYERTVEPDAARRAG